MLIDRTLPGQKLVHGQLITIAGFLNAEETTAHGRYDFRLAANDPSASCHGVEDQPQLAGSHRGR